MKTTKKQTTVKTKKVTKIKKTKKEEVFPVGKKVLIRTVTYHHVGEVIGVAQPFVLLNGCSWVADSGPFNTALSTGSLAEVEPMPGRVAVAIPAIVDVAEWSHALPDKVR